MLEIVVIKAWGQAIHVFFSNTTSDKDRSPPVLDDLLHLIDDLARLGIIELELANAAHQVFSRRKSAVSSDIHRLALLARALATRDQVECRCEAKVASNRHESVIALMVVGDRG